MHEVLEGSNHAMLILDTKPLPFIRKKRFIYDPRWYKESECHGVVTKY